MSKMNETKCKHDFEILDKQFDYWDGLESFIIFCRRCGEFRKVEIEGNDIYIKKGGK
jgi:hypothetical protein